MLFFSNLKSQILNPFIPAGLPHPRAGGGSEPGAIVTGEFLRGSFPIFSYPEFPDN
jgi:hypothetical protein